MKIGILTYHSTHNYGAFLQAYALCHSLRDSTGNDVELINFSMNKAEEMNKKIASSARMNIKKHKYLQKRYSVFEESIKKYQPVTGIRYSTDDIKEFAEWVNGKYDVIITGSDEIWALNGYRGFPTPYWLPYVKNCRKMSYAASSRTAPSDVSDEKKAKIQKYLESFEYIGVRDYVTKELVVNAIGEDHRIHINCDPVFAHDFRTSKEKGKSFIKQRFGVSGRKKVIAIMLNSTDLANEIVKLYSKEFDFISLFNYQRGIKTNVVLNPFEWIDALAGADGLITDFFHGMVFALKNCTPFISFEPRKISDKRFSKSFDLLHRNGLDNHFFMIGDSKEQALREVGNFLADIVSEKAEFDFQAVCENERKLFQPFLKQFPDNTPKQIYIKNKGDCCGCGACEAVCPQKAIMMKKDSEGFLYPEVDTSLCVHCGLCKKACTFNSAWGGIKEKCAAQPISVFGVKHIDESIRADSRSGGMFTALSDIVLNRGGSVYGVALTEDFIAEHQRATTRKERDQFRGSKYIQSRMNGVYAQIRNDLQSGKIVLFSGTPCQTAAVRKAMENENCDRLYLVDIVCHGVPSPMIWRNYLDEMENKYNGKVTAVDFRNKKHGWDAHIESLVINETEHDSDYFSQLFYSHKILRPSCYYCKFKKIIRTSDISLADYWGIDKAIPGFNDNKGVSLVLVNTEKGQYIFDLCEESIDYRTAKLEDSMQNSMRFCYQEPSGRERFWHLYNVSGINGCIKTIKKQRQLKKMKNLKKRVVSFAIRNAKKMLDS